MKSGGRRHDASFVLVVGVGISIASAVRKGHAGGVVEVEVEVVRSGCKGDCWFPY
jgi:hypothetical protein